jgi:hypothetical protein
VQVIRNHLVQGPALGEGDLVAGLPQVPGRQSAVQGIRVEPQVDAGCVWDVVGHVAPHRCEQSLSMSHHRLISLRKVCTQNSNQALNFIDDLSDRKDNTKCIISVNKIIDK